MFRKFTTGMAIRQLGDAGGCPGALKYLKWSTTPRTRLDLLTHAFACSRLKEDCQRVGARGHLDVRGWGLATLRRQLVQRR